MMGLHLQMHLVQKNLIKALSCFQAAKSMPQKLDWLLQRTSLLRCCPDFILQNNVGGREFEEITAFPSIKIVWAAETTEFAGILGTRALEARAVLAACLFSTKHITPALVHLQWYLCKCSIACVVRDRVPCQHFSYIILSCPQ